jgi:protein-tyrosine phosphatase
VTGDDRWLEIPGLYNARDLGGLPADGGTTPRGVFLRSEHLDALDDAGWAVLHDAGVRTVIDLRPESEVSRDQTPRPAWLTTVRIDLDNTADTAFWADYWDNGLMGTPLYYLPHLRAMPERTGSVLRAMAHAEPGAVLFHCAGGRDRTGIVSTVLLRVAGVPDDEIVADYLLTVEGHARLYAAAGRENPESRIEALCAEHGTTVADAFRAVVDGFDTDAFVASSGVSPDDLEALRTRFTPVA